MKVKILLKKSFYVLILAFVGCTDLDENPESFITTDQFYQNEEQAGAAIIAVYNSLNSETHTLYNRLLQIATEMATDDYEAGPRARNAHVRAIAGLTHDASNDRMQELWRQSYDGINRANIAIDKIALISPENINEQVRQRYINEAKFLRALHYFNLVRWFGGVPLVLHEVTALTKENLYVSNASEDAVYAQIISDLTDAENLPTALEYSLEDRPRASSGAAKSLLAKVYLTRQQWQLAADKSKEVIDSQVYGLFDDFADVFNVATKNGKEHIFSAQFKGFSNWNGNMLAGTGAPLVVPGINGSQADALHQEGGLYESYDENDERRDVTFVTQWVSPTNGQLYTFEPHFYKYYDPSTGGNVGESSKNTPIIRYAEVLLIYAEALNELSGSPTVLAYEAIDEVRLRANILPLQDIAPSLTKEEFREAVFEERRKEFVYEYQRWFDLARRGPDYYVQKLVAAGKTNARPKHIHFPIPQRELDLNPNLRQHPDWIN
jgi:hypothetical protein